MPAFTCEMSFISARRGQRPHSWDCDQPGTHGISLSRWRYHGGVATAQLPHREVIVCRDCLNEITQDRDEPYTLLIPEQVHTNREPH